MSAYASRIDAVGRLRAAAARAGTVRPRVPALVRSDPALVFLVLVAAVAYAGCALVIHGQYLTSFDLGVFDQAVFKWSRFELPVSTVHPDHGNLLALHFSPILALLAPLYWFWADAKVLLIAQGVLVAASIVPVFIFARRRIGAPGAYFLAIAYALFWGLASGVTFDFHELAFAPLLVALSILLPDLGRWRAYWVTIGLLLCVKEDLAIYVVFLGVYLMLGREWRRGLITSAVGLAGFLLITKAIMPLISGGSYGFWTYTQFGPGLGSSLSTIVQNPGLVPHVLLDNPEKVRTLEYLVVPFLGLFVYSRAIVLAVPLILERMLSTVSAYWGTKYHYSLAISPVLAMGAADGIRNIVAALGARRRLVLIGALVAAVMMVGGYKLAKQFPLWNATQPSFFSQAKGPLARASDHAVGMIPSGASVMAQDYILPHLSARHEIYEFSPKAPLTDYMVLYTKPGLLTGFEVDFNGMLAEVDKRRAHYRLAYASAGVQLWRRVD